MMTSDQIKSGIMLAGLGIAIFVGWKVYKAGTAAGDYISGLPDRFGQMVDTAGFALVDASKDWVAGGDKATADIAKTAAVIGNSINPASDQNLIYRGVNAWGSSATGTSDWTLGGAVYDYFNPDDYASDTLHAAAQQDAARIYRGAGATGSY